MPWCIGGCIGSIGGGRPRAVFAARQAQPDLPPTIQFNIDLRKQFGIEQRAVFDPVAAINPVTRAQRIE